MKVPGFSLLELVIALLISSMLATGLFMTLSQVAQVQNKVTNITSMYTRASIFLNQMEQDLMGAFIPTQVQLIKQPAINPQASAPTQNFPEPLKTIFSSVMKEGRLELVTFITSNPLAVYTKAKNAKVKPRVMRVVYRLIPDKQHKKSFIVTRQEGTALEFSKYNPESQNAPRAYHMIDGVAELKVAYYVPDSDNKSDEKTVTYKKLTTLSAKSSEEQITISNLPHYVEIILSLWDSAYETQRSFTITIPIVAQGMVTTPDAFKPEENKEKPIVSPEQAPIKNAAYEQQKQPEKYGFLPEKLRKGITIAQGGSIENGGAA